MKKIYSAANLMEAHIMLDLLGQSGIDARLFNENAQGAAGQIPYPCLSRSLDNEGQ
jgi:hypothetical protein